MSLETFTVSATDASSSVGLVSRVAPSEIAQSPLDLGSKPAKLERQVVESRGESGESEPPFRARGRYRGTARKGGRREGRGHARKHAGGLVPDGSDERPGEDLKDEERGAQRKFSTSMRSVPEASCWDMRIHSPSLEIERPLPAVLSTVPISVTRPVVRS